MAWAAPRTYTVGETITAAILNTDQRDNLLALSTHTHGGTAGDGGTSPGPLVKATFTDAVAPAAPGAGLTSIYSVAGVLHTRAGASGADKVFNDTSHTH